MTLISRLFGYVRDMVVAVVFGASGLTDAFFVAFRIPNLFRRMFAEGAFSLAFVPVFSEYRENTANRSYATWLTTPPVHWPWYWPLSPPPASWLPPG